MRKVFVFGAMLLVLSVAILATAPQAAAGIVDTVTANICSFMPDECLRWRRDSLRATSTVLDKHQGRVLAGVRVVDEHEAQLRQRLDAIEANSALLAQRETVRRALGAATLEFQGAVYNAEQVVEQARLWSAETGQFRKILERDVAGRRTQFAAARADIALARGRVDSVLRNIEADLLLGPVTRDLGRIRALSVATSEANRQAAAVLDPVRSILQLAPTVPPAVVAVPNGSPAFDFEAWLATQRAKTTPRS